MKVSTAKANVRAFTLVELLVIVFVLAILATLLMPATNGGPRKARLIICQNNLKQVDLAMRMYSTDYHDVFPWQVSRTNHGTLEYISSGQASPHFKALSGYYSPIPGLLTCPADKIKTATTNAAELTDRNVSYFLNVDASFNVNGQQTNKHLAAFVTGDRNWESNGHAVKPGLFTVTLNLNVNWTSEIHIRGGNLAFADGHVGFVRTNELNSTVQRQSFSKNRLAVP